MTLIVCIDKDGHRSFNHRRQTKDSKVCRCINSRIAFKSAYMAKKTYDMLLHTPAPQQPVAPTKHKMTLKDLLKSKADREAVQTRQNTPRSILFDEKQALVDPTIEVAFIELERADPFLQKADEVIVYRYDRQYPHDDLPFPDLTQDNLWRLQSENQFAGTSHDLITEQVFVRKRPADF